jgi:hypothetical protein
VEPREEEEGDMHKQITQTKTVTCPLVREEAPRQTNLNCFAYTKNLAESWKGLEAKTEGQTD